LPTRRVNGHTIHMPQPPPLDHRLEKLVAVQREMFRLQQQFTDEERRRTLTEAALKALALFHGEPKPPVP
jgi:hypothetical protein